MGTIITVLVVVLVGLSALYLFLGYMWNNRYRPRQLKRSRPTRTWGILVRDVTSVMFTKGDKEGFSRVPKKLKKIITPRNTYITLIAISIISILAGKILAPLIVLFGASTLAVGKALGILKERDQVITRMFQVAHSDFRYERGSELNPWALIRVKEWGPQNEPLNIDVQFPAHFHAEVSKKREDFEKHFDGLIGKNNSWKHDWDTTGGVIHITPIEPLPTSAPYPGSENRPWNEIPLGIGRNGELTWNVAKVPHMLLCGGTGGGKSTAQKNIIYHCIQHPDNWIFFGVDTKMTEFPVFSKYDNVVAGIATDVPQGLQIVEYVYETMMERFELMSQHGVKHFLNLPNPPKAIMIMVDELMNFLSLTKVRNEEGSAIDEMKQSATIRIGDIARLGRAAGVFMVLAMQRPDATVLPGEIKENCGARYACGNQKLTASLMTLDDPAGTEIDGSIPGRGILSLNSVQQDIQGYYSGDDEEWIDQWLAKRNSANTANSEDTDSTNEGDFEQNEEPSLLSDLTNGRIDAMVEDFGNDGPGAKEAPEGWDEPTLDFGSLSDDDFEDAFEALNPATTSGAPNPPTVTLNPTTFAFEVSKPARPSVVKEWDEGMDEIMSTLASADLTPPSAPEQVTNTSAPRKTPPSTSTPTTSPAPQPTQRPVAPPQRSKPLPPRPTTLPRPPSRSTTSASPLPAATGKKLPPPPPRTPTRQN